MSTTIQQMNDALKRYYKLMGAEYNNQFFEYCDDNGFDDLEEEMSTTATDCMLLDFDDDVPFKAKPEDKISAVFNLLLKIYHDPECDFQAEDNEFTSVSLTKNDFKFDPNLINHVTKLHKQQCATLWKREMTEDRSIIKLLTMSHNLHTPYLLHLAGLYDRDRLTAHLKGRSLSVLDWIHESKHCKELRKIRQKHCDLVQAAVHGFFYRVAPKLVLTSTARIDDLLEITARYINAEIMFVHTLAQTNATSCPFQLDACIVYNNTKSTQSAYNAPEFGDYTSYDEEDDGDDDVNKEFADYIGNIKYRLKKEKLLHTIATLDDEKSVGRRVRAYGDQFREFQMNVLESRGKEVGEYPRNHRFCSVIDRRMPTDLHKGYDVVKKDEIIFYEPPDDCRRIPHEALPLWYFDSGETCVLPNVGYAEDKKSTDPMRGVNATIGEGNLTSGNGAAGALLRLSFHVVSVQEIRTYLHLNGQAMRFFPEDIIQVLPEFFANTAMNQKFVASNSAKDMVAALKPKLRDKPFESFYNKWGKFASKQQIVKLKK